MKRAVVIVETLGTRSVSSSDLIKVVGVLATFFGIPLRSNLLISMGIVIFISVVFLVIALIDDGPHTFIILESG